MNRPVNPAYVSWLAQCDYVKNHISKLERSPNAYDTRWLERTTAHYRVQLDELKGVMPLQYLDQLPSAVSPVRTSTRLNTNGKGTSR